MKQRHRVLAWALAGALVLSGIPVRAEGNTVYVSGSGSEENSGVTEGSPLDSVYQAQELLPEGGTILVTSTIYITGEREYLLNDGITLQAAEGLDGPLFEVSEGGELTLGNVALIGNSSTLIANSGVLRMDDSVSLRVKDDGGVGCVYTAEGAATYLNDELVAGEAANDTEQESEEPETAEDAAENSETEKGSGTEDKKEPDKKEPETAETETAESDKKEPETAETETSGPDKKEPETAETETSGTDKKQPETTETETSVTDKKEPETAETETAVTDKKQPETPETETSGTDKKQPETDETVKAEDKKTETAESEIYETVIPVRAEAVETVKNAIIALSIHSRKDVRTLLPVSQAYDGLTEAEKEAIPAEVRQLLDSAKEMAAAYNHTQRGVSVYGNLPWYVQFRVKLTDVGKKEENGKKVLVPYELSLWDLYANAAYTLPEGESVTVTMPVPDVKIDGEFTVFHYKSDGTVESIKPVINGNRMSFETSTFSPFMVAGSTVIAGIGIGSVTPSEGGNGDSSGTGSDGTGTSSGSSTEGTPQTGSTSGSTGGSSQTGSTSNGTEDSSQTGSTSNGNTGSYNTVAVNTGDSTNVLPAAVTALAALLVIVGILIHKKKKEKH